MVQKVRGLSNRSKTWAEKARKVLDGGMKLSLQDAKNLLDAGEKLKVNSQEIRTLRAALRAARGWSNKVKRCNLELGSVHVSNVRDLIDEYENDSFLVEMPEEFATLQQATQSYCVCRRPYSGFMIGCDECEDWYHGPCIGVSESRADRFDKYVCIRCSVKNIFKNSASAAVRIVRKWTNRSDKKKARQVEYQKHQRKVRKETKDIEKFRSEIEKLKRILGNEQIAGNTLTAPISDADMEGDEQLDQGEGTSPRPPVLPDRGTPKASSSIGRFACNCLLIFITSFIQQRQLKTTWRLLWRHLRMLKTDLTFCKKQTSSASAWTILKIGNQRAFSGGVSE
jgi:PHD-finger/PLU-1-like protein